MPSIVIHLAVLLSRFLKFTIVLSVPRFLCTLKCLTQMKRKCLTVVAKASNYLFHCPAVSPPVTLCSAVTEVGDNFLLFPLYLWKDSTNTSGAGMHLRWRCLVRWCKPTKVLEKELGLASGIQHCIPQFTWWLYLSQSDAERQLQR